MSSYAAASVADVHPLLVATDTAILTLSVNDSGTNSVHDPPSFLVSGGSKWGGTLETVLSLNIY